MAPPAAPLAAAPLLLELTGLHKEVLRLWRAAGSSGIEPVIAKGVGKTNAVGVNDPERLRAMLAEREAQYERQEVELQCTQGALEEARRSNRELRARLEEMESRLMMGDRQLAEATKAVASLRPWLQRLGGSACPGDPPDSKPGLLVDEDAFLGRSISHQISDAVTGSDIPDSLADSEEPSTRGSCSDKAALGSPQASAPTFEPLLSPDFGPSLRMPSESSTQKTSAVKDKRHVKSDLPVYQACGNVDDTALAAFQAACLNFAQKARVLAQDTHTDTVWPDTRPSPEIRTHRLAA